MLVLLPMLVLVLVLVLQVVLQHVAFPFVFVFALALDIRIGALAHIHPKYRITYIHTYRIAPANEKRFAPKRVLKQGYLA